MQCGSKARASGQRKRTLIRGIAVVGAMRHAGHVIRTRRVVHARCGIHACRAYHEARMPINRREHEPRRDQRPESKHQQRQYAEPASSPA